MFSVISRLEASGFWLFRNSWDVTLTASYLPDQHDYFVTGKPYEQYARRPQYVIPEGGWQFGQPETFIL